MQCALGPLRGINLRFDRRKTESLVGAGIVVGTCILISVYRQEPRLDE